MAELQRRQDISNMLLLGHGNAAPAAAAVVVRLSHGSDHNVFNMDRYLPQGNLKIWCKISETVFFKSTKKD